MAHRLRDRALLLPDMAHPHTHSPLHLTWFPYRDRTSTLFPVSASTSSFIRATGTDLSEAAGMVHNSTMDHGYTCPVRGFLASSSHCRVAGAGFRAVTAPYPTESCKGTGRGGNGKGTRRGTGENDGTPPSGDADATFLTWGMSLLLTFLLRTQCGAGYEIGFPEDSDIKPQRIVIPLWGFIMVHVSLRNPHYR